MKRAVVVSMAMCGAAFAAPPKVQHGTFRTDASPDGSFDMDKVQATVMKADNTILACYKKGLANDPTLAAQTSIELDIKPNGTVAKATVAKLPPVVETCIVALAKKWKFPRSGAKDNTSVAHDFELYTDNPHGASSSLGPLQGEPEDPAVREAMKHSLDGMTIRHGSGTGAGGSTKTERLPLTKFVDLKADGALDKDIVRRYLKRNIRKLMYCYEKELLASPGIKGTLTMTFTIDAEGNVAAANATGLKSRNVEDCASTIVKTIVFPKPTEGTVKATLVLEYAPTGG